MSRARPTYTEAVAADICGRLAAGESLNAICKDDGMPHESTVRLWVVDDHLGFATRYARARDVGLDALADEILEIADTPQEGVKTVDKATGTETTTGDMIEHRRLRVDARKWYLSKVAPKKYGDRQQVEVNATVAGAVQYVANIPKRS